MDHLGIAHWGVKNSDEYRELAKHVPVLPPDPKTHFKKDWQGWRKLLGITDGSICDECGMTLPTERKHDCREGKLPPDSWLNKHGYTELVKAKNEHPEMFAHIPQASDE